MLGHKNRLTERAKGYRNEVLRKADRLREDPDRQRRLQERKCLWCFYWGRVGTCDMRQHTCSNPGCENTFHGPSVGHNAVCRECSENHFQCVGCGADLDLKVRRK